jgi:hypothetical protein
MILAFEQGKIRPAEGVINIFNAAAFCNNPFRVL